MSSAWEQRSVYGTVSHVTTVLHRVLCMRVTYNCTTKEPVVEFDWNRFFSWNRYTSNFVVHRSFVMDRWLSFTSRQRHWCVTLEYHTFEGDGTSCSWYLTALRPVWRRPNCVGRNELQPPNHHWMNQQMRAFSESHKHTTTFAGRLMTLNYNSAGLPSSPLLQRRTVFVLRSTLWTRRWAITRVLCTFPTDVIDVVVVHHFFW